MDILIRQAINAKRVIQFTYNGHTRVVEPHVYGMKSGATQILGYQIGGGSSKGGIPEWRRFDTSLMAELQLHSDTFIGARAGTMKSSSWDVTYLIVSA
jgi:hypothetical protein